MESQSAGVTGQSESAHDIKLAQEVVDECRATDSDVEAVLTKRWPSGRGGVGIAHIRTFTRVRAAIKVLEADYREWQRTAWESRGEQRYSEYAP